MERCLAQRAGDAMGMLPAACEMGPQECVMVVSNSIEGEKRVETARGGLTIGGGMVIRL